MLPGYVGQKADLVLPRLFGLVMEEVAGVVAYLLDQRCHVGRQTVVLLEIDGEIGVGPPADLARRRVRQGPGGTQRLAHVHPGVKALSARELKSCVEAQGPTERSS